MKTFNEEKLEKISETATFCYKVDEVYHLEDEGGLMYDDPDIGIDWPYVGEILLSEKDKKNLLIGSIKGKE